MAVYSNAQCLNGTSYGGVVAPTGGGSNTQNCNYATEYLPVSGVAAATGYIASSSIGTDFLTIRQGTPGGPVIAFGTSPVSWTSTVAGNYYVHVNTDAACGTASACRNITVTHVIPSIPMTYVSSTVNQASTANVENCSTDKEILEVQVVTAGNTALLDLTELVVATDGSTLPLSDIINVDVYYSGTSPSFSTATLFGSAAPAATGTNIVVNGTQTLAEGTNYFWVAYDVSVGATLGNIVDGICNEITVDGNTEIPSTTNPAGSRTIIDCTMACPSTATVWSETFDSGTIDGANSAVIYGNGGSAHNAALAISGTFFGWFNVVNGVGNVDLYDAYMNSLNVGCEATISYWIRESYGGMNVQISMTDDNGVVVATNNMTLTSTYQQFTHTFTPTTPGVQFLLHTTSTGGSGLDVVLEDLVVTQCCDMAVLLPVELENFEVECQSNEAKLSWSTMTETNNDHFVVQSMEAGEKWTDIGTIDGAGNSATMLNYAFSTEINDDTYFRLKQVDSDGNVRYSEVIMVGACNELDGIMVYPNPAQDKISIEFNSSNDQDVLIFDYMGRLVHKESGNALIQVNTSNWATGLYTVSIGNDIKSFSIN